MSRFDWGALIFVIILLALCALGAYFIAVSDLPAWFKFWLLK